MNKQRRAEIEKARGLIEEAKALLEQAASEEQDYYDNMPESLQNGDKGQAASTAADELDTAHNALDDVLNNIETALEG